MMMTSQMTTPTTLALIAAAIVVPSIGAAQTIPPEAQQIAAAVLPLPEAMRAGAGVMGYRTAGQLVVLRPARNGMQCLADDPSDQRFHVACYATSMEPFMARGRALRASGVAGPQVDTVRFAEVRRGTLKMPTAPAALYSLSGSAADYNPATNAAPRARPLFVMYMPGATEASTGLPTTPGKGPWLMYPGTPKAHLMLTPDM